MRMYIAVYNLTQEQREKLFDKIGDSTWQNKHYYCSISITPTLCWNIVNGRLDGYCQESWYISEGYTKGDVSDFLRLITEKNMHYTIYVEGLGFYDGFIFGQAEYPIRDSLDTVSATAKRLQEKHNKKVTVSKVETTKTEVLVLDQLTFDDLDVGDKFVFCMDITSSGNRYECVKLQNDHILCVKNIYGEPYTTEKISICKTGAVKLLKKNCLENL